MVMCGIRVVGKGHLLTQYNQDGGEQEGQCDLHQRHQDLTFLQGQ